MMSNARKFVHLSAQHRALNNAWVIAFAPRTPAAPLFHNETRFKKSRSTSPETWRKQAGVISDNLNGDISRPHHAAHNASNIALAWAKWCRLCGISCRPNQCLTGACAKHDLARSTGRPYLRAACTTRRPSPQQCHKRTIAVTMSGLRPVCVRSWGLERLDQRTRLLKDSLFL